MSSDSVARRTDDVSLAILAGGRSRRMGYDKAFAPFADSTLIEWLRDRLCPGFSHCFIVAKDVARFRGLGLPVVSDARPVDSPTVGVYTAVAASPTPRVLCLSCDSPFVTLQLLQRLAEGSPGYDAYVARDQTGVQPLCAVYGPETLAALERMLDDDERRLDLLLDYVHTGYLDVRAAGLGDPDELFTNVNTPQDLERAQQRLTAEAGGQSTGPSSSGAASDTAHPAIAGAPAAGVAPDTRGDGASSSHLASPILQFAAQVPLPTVSIVGKKQSGKTTVLVGVIRELTHRGRRVAAFKHDRHGFAVDVPGSDTHTLREAGATVTAIASPTDVAIMSHLGDELPLGALVARVREPVDIVLTEGWASGPAPKLEVSRQARSERLICAPQDLLAIVTDQPFPDYAVPQLSLDAYAAIADLLERWMARQRALHGARTAADAWPADSSS